MHYIYKSDKSCTTSFMCYSNEHLYHLYVSFKYDYSDIFCTKNSRWIESWFRFDMILKTSFHRFIQNLLNYLSCMMQKNFKCCKNHASVDSWRCVVKIHSDQYWDSKALHRSVHSRKLVQESYSLNAETVRYVYEIIVFLILNSSYDVKISIILSFKILQ